MKIIALAQQKGGVGKSTLAIHMAVELLRREKPTAIVDMDTQHTASKWAARREKGTPIVVTSTLPNLAATLADLQAKGVEIALLDLPGQSSPVANAGMKLADLVLVPTRPLEIDLEASAETLAAAIRMKRRYAFVLNSAMGRSGRTKAFAEQLTAHGQPVLPAVITERIEFPDAIAAGLGVAEFQPNGKAAEDISKLTSAVLERIE